jgi:hypothetical protein
LCLAGKCGRIVAVIAHGIAHGHYKQRIDRMSNRKNRAV